MLHTKFHGNRSTGSAEEDFEGLLPYTGIADIQYRSGANMPLQISISVFINFLC